MAATLKINLKEFKVNLNKKCCFNIYGVMSIGLWIVKLNYDFVLELSISLGKIPKWLLKHLVKYEGEEKPTL